jgi:hypothetical protein
MGRGRPRIPAPSAGAMSLANVGAIDLGGTIRATDVEATLARASKVLGAVGITRIGNVTGLDHVGVPTWMVVKASNCITPSILPLVDT